MEDFYDQNKDPVTLFLAPNCGLQIKYDTNTYNAEFGLEYQLLNINDFPLTSNPKEIRGWLSPMRDVTLPNEIKAAVGIPVEATRFSYLYAPRGLADYIDWEKASLTNGAPELKKNMFTADEVTNKWALPFVASFGAYAYFNEDDELLGVNALSLKETPFELNFEGPYIATKEACREIRDMNRYQSLYLDVFGEIGFIGLAWMDPGEDKFIDNEIEGQAEIRNHHGGFLYFRHDGSAVIFLVDVNDSLLTPHHGVGSLIRDAFRFTKHQVRSKRISTTCPSNDQFKNKRIHRACQDGSKDYVSYLLSKTSSESKALYDQDTFGWTPLHYATCYNAQNDELIEMLLKKCPSAAFVANNNGLCPIHVACQHNPSLKVIKMLLECDTDKKTIYMKSKHLGFLPIHFACSNNMTSIEVIRLLILADTDGTTIHETSMLGSTSLHVAIAGNSNHDVIELLLRSASENERPLIEKKVNGLFPLHLACLKSCSPETVALLMKADHNDKIFYQILGCCEEYRIMNSTVLHIALAHSSRDVIDLILMKEVKSRCMPSNMVTDLFDVAEQKEGMLPIHIACLREDLKPETINTVLCLNRSRVCGVDSQGNTPLHLVCSNPNSSDEVIRILLRCENENARTTKSGKWKSNQSAVKMYNGQRQTPLHLAAKARTSGTNVLLEPEYICLKSMDNEAREGLLDLIVGRKDVQENIVKNLAERQYFALIMLELVANITATLTYFDASIKCLDNKPVHPISLLLLFWCTFTFISRELIQLKGSSLLGYITDGWNWIECTSIALLVAATVHMVELRDNEDMVPNRILFTWSGVLLILQFIFIIRTTFLPFVSTLIIFIFVNVLSG